MQLGEPYMGMHKIIPSIKLIIKLKSFSYEHFVDLEARQARNKLFIEKQLCLIVVFIISS